jgi:glutamyl-tRNA reductase
LPFLALGLEHKTAPLPIRERITLDSESVSAELRRLVGHPAITEAGILSTCNRYEMYLYVDDLEAAKMLASSRLIENDQAVAAYVQCWQDLDCARHLFRVASGLESQLLGEGQILSQVREAYEIGQRLDTIGPNLHSLFRSAIKCARQARAGTDLGRVDASLGNQAVQAAEESLGSLKGRSALLIGAGEISRLVGENLRTKKLGEFLITNRTASAATDLGAKFGAATIDFQRIPEVLQRVDVIFTATSSRDHILTKEDVESSVHTRESKLHIFDLAIPRDVDPSLNSLPQIEVHDLERLMPGDLSVQWANDIRHMESVISAEIQEFMAWYLTRRVAPVIASLRSHVEAVSQQELLRVRPQLANLTDREHQAVGSLTQRLIDKMFHHLVTRLRLAAQTDPKLVEAAEFFFLHGEGGLFDHAVEKAEIDPERSPVNPGHAER